MDFKNKWEAILNKCSLDLILLLIEEAKKCRSETQKEIEIIKLRSSEEYSLEHRLPFETKLKDDLNRLSDFIKGEKLSKFKRDQRDYQEGKVYNWNEKRSPLHQTRRVRSVSFNLPSSEDDEGSLSTLTPSGTKDFLDSRHKVDSQVYRRSRGGQGGDADNDHRTAQEGVRTRNQRRLRP